MRWPGGKPNSSAFEARLQVDSLVLLQQPTQEMSNTLLCLPLCFARNSSKRFCCCFVAQLPPHCCFQQALQPLGRPFPALFCVCLVGEVLKAAVSSVCVPSAAVSARQTSTTSSTTRSSTPAAAALAGAAASDPWHQHQQQQALRIMNRLTPTAGSSAPVLLQTAQYSRLRSPPRPTSGNHPAGAQLLLKPSSPFALFPAHAQPSRDGWLRLFGEVVKSVPTDERDDALEEVPHAMLLPRRGSVLAYQQAMGHRVTIL